MSTDRSCYVLETSVQPGGARWAELHAYTSPGHVRSCLGDFLANGAGNSAYFAIRYGMVLGIWVVQRGEVVDFIDLHPFVQVHHGDRPPVALVDDDATSALVYARRREIYLADGQEEEDIPGPDEWDDLDTDIYEEMSLSIDWPAVLARLPALDPPLLAPGQRTALRRAPEKKWPRGSYLRQSVRFGSYDVENGGRLATSFKLDPPSEPDDPDDADD